MPRGHQSLGSLQEADWFSTVDLASGFHQVPVAEADIEKTAFLTRNGLYEFTSVPFGLTCAPATFQRLMGIVLAGLKWRTFVVYLDDVLVFTYEAFTDHLRDLSDVLNRLREHRLRAQPSKCQLFRKELVYPGHIIDRTGLRSDQRLVDAVRNFPIPTDVPVAQRFIGLAGYYRNFIPRFFSVVEALTRLLCRDQL
jgi:hypothetical protein